MMKNKKIGVLMGGWSPEREISLKTGTAIVDALCTRGWKAIGIDMTRDIAFILREQAIDIAFIALHGPYGEDGTIQGLLDIMGIPYTGAHVCASALAMNKLMSKRIFQALELPTPDFWIEDNPHINKLEKGGEMPFGYPLIVKPASGGSTIGVSIVNCATEYHSALQEAFSYDRCVLVEQYIEGRELSVGILDNEAFPVIEIRPKSGFYDYKAKYTQGETEYFIPAELEPHLYRFFQELAVKAYKGLGCRGIARIDFRLDRQNNPFILELNTIPGMTETSLVPKAAKHIGMDFPELVERILMQALEG
ncbi:MAG: D-alanine--D-alanine ligase [bacterium]